MTLPIEVRQVNDFDENEYKLIEFSGLENDSMEAWCATGTNAQLSYATHGIFRYFGKFPPNIAMHLIKEYTSESDTVYDLMSGSGTTGVECIIAHRNCVLNDISPISILLTKVKTTKIDVDIAEWIFREIKTNYKPLTLTEYDYSPVGIKEVDHWFLPQTQDSLRGLIKLIYDIKDEAYRDFFMVCFLATVRPVSKATTQQGRLFLDVVTAQEDAFDTFEKKYIAAKKGMEKLPTTNKSLQILSHDMREGLHTNLWGNAALIILHPPYFNSYKYSSINSLELSWLRQNHAEVRKSEVKEFFKVGKSENVSKYIKDMVDVVINASNGLKDGGHLAIMIGDTIIKGEYVRVSKMLLTAIAERIPVLKTQKIVLRVPKYTEASWAASQRRKANDIGVKLNDFILILRKV